MLHFSIAWELEKFQTSEVTSRDTQRDILDAWLLHSLLCRLLLRTVSRQCCADTHWRLLRWPCLAESVMLRSGVRLSDCPVFFLTLIGHVVHTQRDSPGAARNAASVHIYLSEY